MENMQYGTADRNQEPIDLALIKLSPEIIWLKSLQPMVFTNVGVIPAHLIRPHRIRKKWVHLSIQPVNRQVVAPASDVVGSVQSASKHIPAHIRVHSDSLFGDIQPTQRISCF